MALPTLNLVEPLVDAMVGLLESNLNGTIDTLNATLADDYTVPHAVQFLPFVPIPSTLQGGMPAIGVQELPSEFVDDLQFSVAAVHRYVVVATIQNADQMTLTLQLRRMIQAIAYTIQADRMLELEDGTGGVMRAAGALSVNFEGTEPGPLLGDIDPVNADMPPRTYLSWTALSMNSRRTEV